MQVGPQVLEDMDKRRMEKPRNNPIDTTDSAAGNEGTLMQIRKFQKSTELLIPEEAVLSDQSRRYCRQRGPWLKIQASASYWPYTKCSKSISGKVAGGWATFVPSMQN